jgi:hypothetical protein
LEEILSEVRAIATGADTHYPAVEVRDSNSTSAKWNDLWDARMTAPQLDNAVIEKHPEIKPKLRKSNR